MAISKLYGKLKFKASLKLITGMHISSSSDFSAIGAVDTVVIRDPFTYEPIIPGSSLKGKLRYLLSRVTTDKKEISGLMDERVELKRLFGTAVDDGESRQSRLQFYDVRLMEKSRDKMQKMDFDLPYTEIKFENTIDRITGMANPRQIERVPAGAEFNFQLVYNIESLDEMMKDLELLKTGLEVLQMDYIGGHGSRGYGKVTFGLFEIELKNYSEESIDLQPIQNMFK